MKKCKRTVLDLGGTGKTEDIEVDWHSFRYAGTIPCTGRFECKYCGKIQEELREEE